jgi:hypothetical protein
VLRVTPAVNRRWFQVLRLLFDLNLARNRLDDLLQVPIKDIIELMDQVAAAKTRLQPPYVKIYRPFQGTPGEEGTSCYSPLTASHRCEACMRRTAGAEEEGEKETEAEKAEGTALSRWRFGSSVHSAGISSRQATRFSAVHALVRSRWLVRVTECGAAGAG